MPRRRKSNLNSAVAMLFILTLIVMVASAVMMSTNQLKSQIASCETRIEALDRQIKEEENRTLVLEEKKDYALTTEAIAQMAREKLGLINPDEVLLKENEE